MSLGHANSIAMLGRPPGRLSDHQPRNTKNGKKLQKNGKKLKLLDFFRKFCIHQIKMKLYSDPPRPALPGATMEAPEHSARPTYVFGTATTISPIIFEQLRLYTSRTTQGTAQDAWGPSWMSPWALGGVGHHMLKISLKSGFLSSDIGRNTV